MKSIHDMQFWAFLFPRTEEICAERCDRIKLERMSTVEIIILNKVSAIHFL